MNEYDHLKTQVDAIEAAVAKRRKDRLDAFVAMRVALDAAASADSLDEAQKICGDALITSFETYFNNESND